MPTIEQAQLWYKGADPVHDFNHVLRVYRTAERLATIEGADLEIVHAAALLHDAEGSAPGTEARLSHHESSAEFAGKVLSKEGWSKEGIAAVQHCILAHRFRNGGITPETIEAQVIFDADKLDVLGAIGVARVVGYAVLNNQPIYVEPSEEFVRTGTKNLGEPHSAYHEYLFKLRKIKDRLFTKTAREMAADRDAYLNNFFQQLSAELSGER
jgi:uncharacterized protein